MSWSADERVVEQVLVGGAVAAAVGAALATGAMYDPALAAPTVLFAGAAATLAWPSVRERDARALGWPVGAAMLTVAVGGWYQFVTSMGGPGTPVADPTIIALAAVLGALVGTYDRRARERDRERRATAAARAESLSTLNAAFRHYLRNGLNVVGGYADLLEDHVDEEGRAHLDTLRRRVDRLDDTVEDLGTLTAALDGDDPRLDAVDLDATLAAAVEEFEGAQLEESIDVTVGADALLPRALRALFEVVAARAGTPVVVRVRRRETDVVVDVAGPDGNHDCDLDASLAADEGLPTLLLDAVADRYRGEFITHGCDCAHLALPLAGELSGELPDTPDHTSPTVT